MGGVWKHGWGCGSMGGGVEAWVGVWKHGWGFGSMDRCVGAGWGVNVWVCGSVCGGMDRCVWKHVKAWVGVWTDQCPLSSPKADQYPVRRLSNVVRLLTNVQSDD